MFDVPILFLVFNRPDTTRQVFERIKAIKPTRLFIAADGPRLGNSNDTKGCAEVKSIVSAIDWSCEVHTLFREENLGCGKAVSGAITWFFENVEEGIILEDDTLPSPSFFSYCRHLLKEYRNDDNVMHIGGCNFDFFKRFKAKGTYFFANLSHIWGWATWRRAWQKYDFDMKDFESKIDTLDCDRVFKNVLQKTYTKEINTWDYQWMYAIYANNGKTVIPQKNLISNLGFREDATHTTELPLWNKLLKSGEIKKMVDSEPIRYCNFYEQLVIKNTIQNRYSFLERLYLKFAG